MDSAYESGPLLSLTSACFFCLVKVTSCWPATQWNLSALLVAGTSCSVVSAALIRTLCLVYSGGTVGAPPPFLSLVPSVFLSLIRSSFLLSSFFLTIPTQNSSYTVDPESICVSAGSRLYWERPRWTPGLPQNTCQETSRAEIPSWSRRSACLPWDLRRIGKCDITSKRVEGHPNDHVLLRISNEDKINV